MTHFRFVSPSIVLLCFFISACQSGAIGGVPSVSGSSLTSQAITETSQAITDSASPAPVSFSELQAFSATPGVDMMHARGATGEGSTVAYVTNSGFDTHPEFQHSTVEEYTVELHARVPDGTLGPTTVDYRDYFDPAIIDKIDILHQGEHEFTFSIKMALEAPYDASKIAQALKVINHPGARASFVRGNLAQGIEEVFLAVNKRGEWVNPDRTQLTVTLVSLRDQHNYRIVGATRTSDDGSRLHIETSLHPDSRHHASMAHVDEDIGIFAMVGAVKDPDRENDAMNTYGMAHQADMRLHTTDPIRAYTSAPTTAITSARGATDESHIVVFSNRLYIGRHTVTLSNADLILYTAEEVKSFLQAHYGGTLQRHRDIISPMLVEDDDDAEDIFVLAAVDGRTNDVGNHGVIVHHYPQLQDRSLIAVAMEEGHTPCGAELEDFCLAAPGAYRYRSRGEDKVYSTADDVMKTDVSANAAAAHIAGALALLQDMFDGTVSPKELVERVKMTADSEFDGFTAARYGKGILDLDAASQPVVMASDSPSASDMFCAIDGLRFIVSGDLCSKDYVALTDANGDVMTGAIGTLSLGTGFTSMLSGGFTFFDALDTPWQADSPYNPYAAVVDLARVVTTSLSRLTLGERLDALRDGTTPSQQGRWTSGDTAVTFGMSNVSTANLEEGRFMLSVEKDKLRLMGMNNVALSYALGLHGDALAGHKSSDKNAFHAPYLALASGGISGGISYDTGKNGRLAFVVGEGTSLNDSEKARAFAAMVEYAPHRNVMFHAGMLQEDSTLLESDGSGLFDIQGGSTMFFGMQATQRISENWQVLLSGYGGRTQLDGSQGIISDLDVVTSSFDVGVLGSDVMERGDTLLVRVGQPMRVESGTLDVSYVTSRRQDGSTIATTQSMSMTPQARAIELNLSYDMPLNRDNGHIRFMVSHTINPNHQQTRDETVGILSFQQTF